MVVYVLFWLVVVVNRYYSAPIYCENVNITAICCEAAVFWASLVSFFHCYLDTGYDDDSGAVFLLIGTPFAMFGVYSINMRKRMWWI